MNLSSSLASFWAGGVLSSGFFGLGQQPFLPGQNIPTAPITEDAYLNKVPSAFEHLSVSYIKDNLAVIPGEWEAGGISKCLPMVRCSGGPYL